LYFIQPDLFLIPQRTLPWQPILDEIGEITFIQHTGILKQIRISQLRFTGVKWQYLFYILSKFDQDQSTNPF